MKIVRIGERMGEIHSQNGKHITNERKQHHQHNEAQHLRIKGKLCII